MLSERAEETQEERKEEGKDDDEVLRKPRLIFESRVRLLFLWKRLKLGTYLSRLVIKNVVLCFLVSTKEVQSMARLANNSYGEPKKVSLSLPRPVHPHPWH